MNTGAITLSRMRFHACHGALPSEKTQPQPWEVTVTLELPGHILREAAATDDLAKTIDYRRIHAAARAVMDGPPLNLAETLAERIAQNLLREFAQARAVEVEVCKPNPPVDFASDGLRVRVRLERAAQERAARKSAPLTASQRPARARAQGARARKRGMA